MDTKQTPRLRTVGKIAEELNQPVDRIRYLIKARAIRPAALAGNYQLFNSHAVARLRYELNLQDARRGR